MKTPKLFNAKVEARKLIDSAESDEQKSSAITAFTLVVIAECLDGIREELEAFNQFYAQENDVGEIE